MSIDNEFFKFKFWNKWFQECIIFNLDGTTYMQKFWYIKYCSSLMVCKIININEYITSRNFLGTSTFGFLFISLIIHCEQKKWKLIWWKSGSFYFSLFSYFFLVIYLNITAYFGRRLYYIFSENLNTKNIFLISRVSSNIYQKNLNNSTIYSIG